MLKSTHRLHQPPAPPLPPPLPPGWTEHKAPTGHAYYYHAESKTSTYARPVPEPPVPPVPQPFLAGPPQPAFAPSLPFHQEFGHHHGALHDFSRGRGGFRGGRGHQDRRRTPEDRPKHKYVLPDCAPWVLVKTKLGRRFVHNLETKESFWKFPEDVAKAVLDYDIAELKKKDEREKPPQEDPSDETPLVEADATKGVSADSPSVTPAPLVDEQKDGESSEYEEVEVTDDEEGGDPEHRSKRQRTDDEGEDKPVEFNEDDIAWQLQAMGQDYGLDAGEYGMDEAGEWEEGAEGLPLTEEDTRALFRDLLEDFNINPFSTWEKIVEDGHIIEDDRYTVLPNMQSRREAFAQWSRDKIHLLKEQRANQEKKDPSIPYLAFLQKHATPKLYWPEFKRKHRKEPEMKDSKVPDRDREKWYREHIKRLQMPQSTLKSDLSALLKSIPLSALNCSTSLATLPSRLLTDLRYISLPASTRDPLVEAYISTLPSAPEASGFSEEDEADATVRKQERQRREKALAEREQRVQEAKRRQKRDVHYGRERLREEERELQKAMHVGKQGLRAQLDNLDTPIAEAGEEKAD